MNKNCLCFNIVISDINSIPYYGMLYQALKTLMPFYTEKYDIVVFYDFNSVIDINTYKYNNNFSLLEFDKVKFIQSDYSKKYIITKVMPRLHDAYISKWYNIGNLFSMGYEKVFFNDCDILFYKNIDYFFQKYNLKNTVYGLGAYDKVFSILYPTIEPFMSGQLIIDKTCDINWEAFYTNVIGIRNEQNNLSEKLYRDNIISLEEKNAFQYFNEQYAPFIYMKKSNTFLHLEENDYHVINWRTLDKQNIRYKISIKNNNIILNSIDASILHYCGTAAAWCLLPEYRQPYCDMIIKDRIQIIEKQMIGNKT